MGGLARRVSYIKAFRHRSNGEVPALFVDAGNLFTDEKYSIAGLPADAQVKNRWVLKGYEEFRTDAANISHHDLPYLSEVLKRDNYEQRVQETPFVRRLISANIRPIDDSHIAPAPYVIRELTLRRGSPNTKIKIGILGLTEVRITGPNQKENSYAGFVIDDPFERAKTIISELKGKVDYIVILAYMPQEDLQRLATENPEIDSIIGARQVSSMNDPVHFNRATITTAYNQTKYLGELRIYLKGDGTIENQVNRYVGLEPFIPDDPAALEMVTKAHDEFTNEQNRTKNSSVPPTTLLGNPSNSPLEAIPKN